jgi:vacuolar-type H+-ATPase subunit I/STV1
VSKNDDKLMDTYRELTAGLHKTGLAVHGISVTQEANGRRIDTLESIVTTSDNSLQTRVAKLEDRIVALEEEKKQQKSDKSALLGARMQSKATVIAAWIGASAGIIGAIVALIIALQ